MALLALQEKWRPEALEIFQVFAKRAFPSLLAGFCHLSALLFGYEPHRNLFPKRVVSFAHSMRIKRALDVGGD